MNKKVLLLMLVAMSLLQAKDYTSDAVFTAESKNKACSGALSLAKVNAMEQAGTLVLSSFDSNKGYSQEEIKNEVEQKLMTVSLGIAKLQNKFEDVSITSNYQFTCKVQASFSIDQEEMKEQYKKLLDAKELEDSAVGYFEADGYSEEGQSRYKAFTSATLVAQRNLLENIKGAKIISSTKFNSGKLDDKIIKLLDGTIRGATVVKKEYDKTSKSAYVSLQISKLKVLKALTK